MKTMSDDVGYVRLYDPETKIEYTSIVLVVQEGEQFNFCPVWKEENNRLVPIMRATENFKFETPFDGKIEFYIDASDPFAYELWTHKNLGERIAEFNKTYADKGIENVKIYKIASVSDLERAGLPVYRVEGSKRVIIIAE